MVAKCKYTALDIANWFIEKANHIEIDDGVYEGITNLKLQKIVYLAQAASLAINGKPLFNDEIQAWMYGPVIPSVYNHYHSYKDRKIDKPDKTVNIDTKTTELLESVWELFGGYSASQLVTITHGHSPWIDTFRNGQGARQVIPQEKMRLFYRNIFSLAEE